MSDAVLSLLPSSRVYHIGLFREKVSLQPVECNVDFFLPFRNIHDHDTSQDYSKLHRPTVDLCLLLDPMVATGGTACAAIEMLLDWGLACKRVRTMKTSIAKPHNSRKDQISGHTRLERRS